MAVFWLNYWQRNIRSLWFIFFIGKDLPGRNMCKVSYLQISSSCKIDYWDFFYLYLSTTSTYLILPHFPHKFSVCLIWHSLHKFYFLKPIFSSPSENLNLVFVIICITAIAMGPRWNQSSILLAQIHAEKQYLLWRLDNSGIQSWTPQRDVHFKHIVKQ